ncbi:hypothetical protein B0T22DRAFT_96803 [Podospora appendiculata]|uniref:Uncharacterized protein n=1 Tax=Podospora appendiculata TaxID=314037 RepID=A0AAE0XKQ7_9PEZI|nr:hypothetical protein B0T22DRAFT_96803 [Podospora appendiculata]
MLSPRASRRPHRPEKTFGLKVTPPVPLSGMTKESKKRLQKATVMYVISGLRRQQQQQRQQQKRQKVIYSALSLESWTMLPDADSDFATDCVFLKDSAMRFDDGHCVSVSRSIQRPGDNVQVSAGNSRNLDAVSGIWNLYMTPTDLLDPDSDDENDDNDDDDEMEDAPGDLTPSCADATFSPIQEHSGSGAFDTRYPKPKRRMSLMSMPFSFPSKRPRVIETHEGLPDDWSVIADSSLVPTYGPSEIIEHPARLMLLKNAVAKARIAKKKMMRDLEFACRTLLQNALDQQSRCASQQRFEPTKCVAVGAVH